MSDSILSTVDLKKLTGYTRAAEQRRALDEQGIPYKAVGKKITIVLTLHVAAWVEGRPMTKHAEPNLSAIS